MVLTTPGAAGARPLFAGVGNRESPIINQNGWSAVARSFSRSVCPADPLAETELACGAFLEGGQTRGGR